MSDQSFQWETFTPGEPIWFETATSTGEMITISGVIIEDRGPNVIVEANRDHGNKHNYGFLTVAKTGLHKG